jgi:hypothetical protein
MATVAELVERSRTAYAALVAVAETVDDEWQHVADLQAAWLAELDGVAATRGDERRSPRVEAAIERLIDEIGRVTDPHRAIDWLSTFPQAALLALGEP